MGAPSPLPFAGFYFVDGSVVADGGGTLKTPAVNIKDSGRWQQIFRNLD